MTVYIIVGVIVIIVGSLWLWGAAKIFGTLFSWWLNSDDDQGKVDKKEERDKDK